MARLSLCVLALSGLLALGALGAQAAQAAPFKPVLTSTNPASPGTSLTPRIKGQEGGLIISVIRSRVGGGGRATAALHPDDEITVYMGDATCSDAGAVVAVGSVDELEDTGIPVPLGAIAPDSVTTFYATQDNGSETSACSAGLSYRQVTTPPDPPTFDSVSPASPADDNLPRLVGAADPEATVSVFSSATCAGASLATGTGADFGGSGIQVPVADNSTTTFYASALLAGISSGCSTSSITYEEVTSQEEPPQEPPKGGGEGGGKGPAGDPPAPNPPGKPEAPKLRTIPGGTANNNLPLVTGSAPEAASVEIFAGDGCKGQTVARGSVAEFTAGLRVQVAENATVVFYGIAVDGGGDRSACSPAPAVYVEDSTAPLTRITMGPGVKTRKRTAVFRFLDAAGEAVGTAFQCKLDRGKWRPCKAPFRAKRLSRRPHVFRVKGADLAGNRETKPAKRRFKVIR